jgi:predicted double-glycine peptidase
MARCFLAATLGLLTLTVDTRVAAAVVSLKESREVGVVRQQWDTSCGAAALATVFTFAFNDPMGEHEVALGLLQQTQPLKVRFRGGFSLLDMKRFSEKRGYKAAVFSDMGFDDVRYLESPIVPLNIHGYNHYVVLKGVDPEGNVLVSDPAYGNRKFSRSTFEKSWIDGMAFVLARTS